MRKRFRPLLLSSSQRSLSVFRLSVCNIRVPLLKPFDEFRSHLAGTLVGLMTNCVG